MLGRFVRSALGCIAPDVEMARLRREVAFLEREKSTLEKWLVNTERERDGLRARLEVAEKDAQETAWWRQFHPTQAP